MTRQPVIAGPGSNLTSFLITMQCIQATLINWDRVAKPSTMLYPGTCRVTRDVLPVSTPPLVSAALPRLDMLAGDIIKMAHDG